MLGEEPYHLSAFQFIQSSAWQPPYNFPCFVLAGGTVVLLRSFLSLTYLKAALDALVGSNPEEVGMDFDPDLVYWCNIRLVNSW